MKIRFFEIQPALKSIIDKIWLFESSYGLHPKDLKMVVPSGRLTLIYTLEGNYRTKSLNGLTHSTYAHDFTIIGQQSCALMLSGLEPVTSLGLTFTSTGAHQFLKENLLETRYMVLSLEDIFNREAKVLKEKIFDVSTDQEKVEVLQAFVISKLSEPKSQEPLVAKVVQNIIATKGLITLSELCEETGWSKRHLNRIFSEIVGHNIKAWSQIIRFQYFYKVLQKNSKEGKDEIKEFYSAYYDQAHFIKSFKKTTGKAPNQLQNSINQFGNYFNRIE